MDDHKKAFINVLEKASSKVDTARKYQTTIVKLMNPKAGITDQKFAFPITPFNKPPHPGMTMVFGKIMEALQFVTNDGKGRFGVLPDTALRKVHFHVDGLSSPNYFGLNWNLIWLMDSTCQSRIVLMLNI